MFRRRFLFWLTVVTLILEATCVQAKPKRSGRQAWLPSMAGLVSRLPSLSAISSQLPSLPNFSSIQTLFSPGGGGSMFGPALADFGSYLSDTMPAFSDVYASIPSWGEWQGMLPNIPRPSSIYGQLPTEVQSGLQQMWAQTNPLDVETFRRRQYQRGAMLMLGLAGFYSGYQGRYKEYRKGIEQYVEPRERKRKYTEMKRVCYYSLPRTKQDNDSLPPADIKSGLCTHLVLNDATVSADSGAVSLSYDETDDGHLQDMIGKLKDAAPKILLCVGGPADPHSVFGTISGDALQHMVHSKEKRLKFIRSSMGLVRRYGLAGVDVDWRLGADGSHLADLFEEFRGYMEPWGNEAKDDGDKAGPLKDVVLSATLQAMPWVSFAPDDVRRLAKHADWINVRAFDFDGGGYYAFNAPTHHSVPLLQARADGRRLSFSVANSVRAWTVRGVPHEKLVLGVSLFGRSYHTMPQPGSEHAAALFGFSNGFDVVDEPDLMGQPSVSGNGLDSSFSRRNDSPDRMQKAAFSQHQRTTPTRSRRNVRRRHGLLGDRQVFAMRTRRKASLEARAYGGSFKRTARAVIGAPRESNGAPIGYAKGVAQSIVGPGALLRKTGLKEMWQEPGRGYTPNFRQEATGPGVNVAFSEDTALIPRVKITLNIRSTDTLKNSSPDDSILHRKLNFPRWATDRKAIVIGGDQDPSSTMVQPMKDMVNPFKGAAVPMRMPDGLSSDVPTSVYDPYALSGAGVALNEEYGVLRPDGKQLPEAEMLKNMVYPYNGFPKLTEVPDKQLPNSPTSLDPLTQNTAETTKGGKGEGEKDVDSDNNLAVMKEAEATGDMANDTVSEGAQTMKDAPDQISDSLMRDFMMSMIAKEQDSNKDETTTPALTAAGSKGPNGGDMSGVPAADDQISVPNNDLLEADLDHNGVVPYSKICRMIADDGGFQVMRDSSSLASIASNGIHSISFDDQRDIAMKARWSEDMGLGGVALFSLNEDDWRGKCDPNGTPFPMARTVWKMIG